MKHTQKQFVNTADGKFSSKQQRYERYSGFLGLYSDAGEKIVAVPNRAGYVYVRLLNDLSSSVQAYNDAALDKWGITVEVERTQGPKGYVWRVLGVDSSSVANITIAPGTPFLPRHGDQHSFNLGTTGTSTGSDPVWVYKEQFMPLNVVPTNPLSMSVVVNADTYKYGDQFKYFPTTQTADFSALVPGSVDLTRFLTVCLNAATNTLTYITGTVEASSTVITDPYDYFPVPTSADEVPLKGLMLRGLTTTIRWSNMFDVRTIFDSGVPSTPLTTNHIFVGVGGVATDVAMNGDGTIISGSMLALINSGVTQGTYGSDTIVPQITVDAKGRITAASDVNITMPSVPVSVYNEIHIANGSTTYYLTNVAVLDTVRAYVNGIRQPVGDGDVDSDVVTFDTAPSVGDVLIFDYELSMP